MPLTDINKACRNKEHLFYFLLHFLIAFTHSIVLLVYLLVRLSVQVCSRKYFSNGLKYVFLRFSIQSLILKMVRVQTHAKEFLFITIIGRIFLKNAYLHVYTALRAWFTKFLTPGLNLKLCNPLNDWLD